MADYDQPSSGGQGAYIQGGQYDAYGGYVQSGYDQSIQYDADGFVQDDGAGYADEVNLNNAPQSVGFMGKIAGITGAVASLALVVGIGVWGYKLVMRDVSGVPVVRAIDGPMRIQPENPGGKEADHQGLAVNAVAAQGTAADPADTLRLAPKPVTLSDEDKPQGDGEPVSQPVADVTATLAVPAPVEEVGDDAIAAFRNGEVDAMVNELTAGIPSLLDDGDAGDAAQSGEAGQAQIQQVSAGIVQPEPLLPVELSDIPEAQNAVFQGPGLARSLRPVVRPSRASEAQAIEAALQSAVLATADADIDPETLPAGTRLAQLGAFESAEIARAEWDRLNTRFGDFLDGKKRVIQMASSGGRTFYRLRAMGFDDLSDARRFCSALVAGNAECIPVTTR